MITFEAIGGANGERRSPSRGAGEWVGLVRPAYAFARGRHTIAREEAYEVAREDAIAAGMCGPELRLTDIDREALEAWRSTWTGTHPSGTGKWNWPALLERRLPHRAAVLPIAIWHGSDLCGMALGHASRHRANGSRHTVTLSFVERRPEPPHVPLRGQVVSIAVAAALSYGLIIGARRIRLRNPDRNLLAYYRGLGFTIVWSGGMPVYCEREV